MKFKQPPVIVVTSRISDYHACIKGDPGKCGSGSSPNEAIGNLIMAHQHVLIKVEERGRYYDDKNIGVCR